MTWHIDIIWGVVCIQLGIVNSEIARYMEKAITYTLKLKTNQVETPQTFNALYLLKIYHLEYTSI